MGLTDACDRVLAAIGRERMRLLQLLLLLSLLCTVYSTLAHHKRHTRLNRPLSQRWAVASGAAASSSGNATAPGSAGHYCDNGWLVGDRKRFWDYNDDKSPGLSDAFHAEERLYVLFNLKIPGEYRGISWHAGNWTFLFKEAGYDPVPAYSIGVDGHGHTLTIQTKLPKNLAAQHDNHQLQHLDIEVSVATGQRRRYKNVPFCLYPTPSSTVSFKDLVACTQVKYFAAHQLPEWIIYHQLQGFQHFYIYVNDEPDKIAAVRDLLAPVTQDGIVTVVDWNWPAHHMHNFQYQQAEQNGCLMRHRGRARWVGLHDVDEYFQPMVNDTVAGWLAKHGDLEHNGAIQVKSIWFGSHANFSIQDPLDSRGHGLVSGQYVYRSNEIRGEKLLGRPDGMQYFSVHHITTGGQQHNPDPWKELRLVHYKLPKEHKYTTLDDSMHVYTNSVWDKLRWYGFTEQQLKHP